MFWKLASVVTLLKVLLIPCYFSTDFEVHRNWLALTHNLPFKDWYYEETSEWTLDYPPFFAWFEKGLSYVAEFFDPEMLVISNLNYRSPATILFQRLSVIVTDLVFIYAVKEYCVSCMGRSQKSKISALTPAQGLAILMLGNAGLLIVDHIHFQYNGFLYGILLLSICKMSQGKYLKAAFLFAALLNFKHLYLYMAPAYFIYLLRNYCISSNKDGSIRWSSFSMIRLLILGVIVVDVCLASFGPFLVIGQMPQVVSRLFPFKRGLCHAYWAPNIWALYNTLDKGLSNSFQRLRLGWPQGDTRSNASMTGGLVQEFEHLVLPTVTPLITLCCTVIVLLPVLTHTWLYSQGPRGFLRCLTLCAWGAYMFGWHVHEKAIIMIILPLTLLAYEKRKDARIFLILSTVGHYSLFPLIFTQPEMPLKYCLVVMYTLAAFAILGSLHESNSKWYCLPLLNPLETLYILGLIPLEVYNTIIHSIIGLDTSLPFLPLLLTSVYCSVGVLYAWLRFYWITVSDRNINKNLKTD